MSLVLKTEENNAAQTNAFRAGPLQPSCMAPSDLLVGRAWGFSVTAQPGTSIYIYWKVKAKQAVVQKIKNEQNSKLLRY